jgi:alkylated DNA repair dioxygenase AlkB
MTNDLFSNASGLESVRLADAEMYYLSRVELPKPADDLLRSLIERVPWRAEEVMVWGKRHPQPRLIAWYGDRGRGYTYSGIRLEPLPWNETLLKIKDHLEHLTASMFNSVLLNYYRDQNDSMGFHSDDEPELGPQPVIASLSLGERRTFVLKHKNRKDLKPVKIALESGSLLVMKGDTQKNWKHGIDKETRPCGPRVNMTFRDIVPPGTRGVGDTS